MPFTNFAGIKKQFGNDFNNLNFEPITKYFRNSWHCFPPENGNFKKYMKIGCQENLYYRDLEKQRTYWGIHPKLQIESSPNSWKIRLPS